MGRKSTAGIVLAGGQSSRMGEDKARLPWGEQDLLQVVLESLATACDERLVVSQRPRELPMGVIQVADIFPRCGPLGGIHAGLQAMQAECAFVVACDMPYLRPRAVHFLLQSLADWDAVIPVQDGLYEPLHGVYHRRCLPTLERQLRQGNYKILDAVRKLRVLWLPGQELRRFDPDLRMFRNLNTPDEYRVARERWE